ncbi:MAG TPA: ATP-binding protein [Cyanothece sp. UBA12306]|nr:ATP-binding protein [Cyanothece sp. UBA12306]
MTKTFGSYISNFPQTNNSLELIFNPTSSSIKRIWRNNRLSAHFIADYFSNFLPIDENDPVYKQKITKSKGAVSYVTNELLENTMKFSDPNNPYDIKFGVHFVSNPEFTITVFATNAMPAKDTDKFQKFIQELLSCDPDQFYVSQIEKSLLDEDGGSSGLGLLTMMTDYAAKLGWKFEDYSEDPQIVFVTTMVQIVL